MKNSPFKPLFGERPTPSGITDSFKEMKQRGKSLKKAEKEKLDHVSQPSQVSLNQSQQQPIESSDTTEQLSGFNQFDGILANKKLLLLVIIILIVFVAIAVILYKQSKQKKSIAIIAKQLKMLKAR